MREWTPATNTTADQVHKLVSRFVIKVRRECTPNWCDDKVIVHADIADSRTSTVAVLSFDSIYSAEVMILGCSAAELGYMHLS